MLLAKSVQKPRATPASLQAAYQFSVEIIVGDMPPMVSAAELRGGWFEYGPGMPGWEMPIQVDAHFPDLKLQAPPPRVNINSRISWDEGQELTQPQPIDEPLELRVIVKRRSDEKVAVLLSLATQLRDWMPHPRYGFGDDDQAETACVGMGCIGKEPLRVWPPPSWVEPTGRELVGGSYGLEVEMYWAGPADRWGNRDREPPAYRRAKARLLSVGSRAADGGACTCRPRRHPAGARLRARGSSMGLNSSDFGGSMKAVASMGQQS